MPHGRVHSAATTAILLTVGVMASGIVVTNSDYAGVALGVASGYLLSPDLDVDDGNISLHYLRRLPFIGRLLAILWRIMWKPYAFIMPHRSRASHAPILSTLGRLLYLSVWAFPFWCVLGVAGEAGRFWFSVFVGLCLPDTAHYLMDNAGTEG